MQIAVKRLKAMSAKAEIVEVEVLGRVRHKNLLGLWGFYAGGEERLIVYDYMPNHSLITHLHGQLAADCLLDWPRRMTIAIGSAEGLAYCYQQSNGRNSRNDLKKVSIPTNDAVLSEIKVALKYFGRPSLQKQGRTAHILLKYELTYTTFSAAENILIPRGEEFPTALILTNFRNLRQIGVEGSDSKRAEVEVAEESVQSEAEVDEALKVAFEEASLNSANSLSTLGRGEVYDDIFIGLEDLPGAYPEDMARLSLTQLTKKANTERMTAWRRVEAIQVEANRSEVPPVTDVEPPMPVIEETVQI
ncbi:putative proline-rich receptor-like protein kinase PERK6 [Camellia sinensis]|uniref:putative proline-rich receptor-like protein kinase PERK6 n=1 Tax=Camellia sinensis TaxID=4442 RepID=UPI001035A671|nr:putative proline-rich receptor-like protein kinase PERK6 [Camellia sinensis]